jgi:hypothetical protein
MGLQGFQGMEKIVAKLSRCSYLALARLMELGSESTRQPKWSAEELAGVFQHQMSTSIALDLAAMNPPLARRLSRLRPRKANPFRTFGDLFGDEAVPAELLELVLEFAEENLRDPSSPMPTELARVLYFGCLANAARQGSPRIRELDRQALCRGFEWVLGLAWVDARAKGLFRKALPFVGLGETDQAAWHRTFAANLT